jgi:sortase A
MTAASIIGTSRKGGRAAGRVLSHAALFGLCLFGLTLMAQGALIPAKAWVAQILLDRAFDESLSQHRPVKPWFWADTTPIARIGLSRLGVSDIVLSGGSGQAMAFGPTLLPMGRQSRVSIMAAHRDTHFAFLKQAKKGDTIDVQSIDGRTRRYRITGFQIVRWDRFAYPRDPARPLLALTTCYPFGATGHGPLRYVAWAEET